MTDFFGKRWHDMGGETAGEIDRDEHDFAIWEKRVDALVLIAQARGIFTVDALRRVLEDLGEDAFEKMTYYERWVASLNQNLLEQGIYSIEELTQKMEEIGARGQTYGDAASA